MLDRARRLLSRRRPPAHATAELFLSQDESREVGWSDGRPKDRHRAAGGGAAVRIFDRGRLGFASGTDASPEGVDALWERAERAAALVPAEPSRRAPAPRPEASVRRASSADGRFAASPETLERRLARLETALLKSDRRLRRVLNMSFGEARETHAVVSTAGVAAAESGGSASFGLELLGESEGETQVAWGSTEKTGWRALDVAGTVEDVRGRLLESFGAGPLRTGTWPVVFEPRVGAEMWEFLSEAVTGDAVAKGRSFLAGPLGRRVGSDHVALVDDGRRPGAVASSLWDDEGVPTGRTAVVDRGVLRSWLHDSASAARAGAVSTGNAVRDGWSSAPSPGPSNFFLAPGRGAARALLSATPRAFIVRDLIGLHTADAVSGDFSVGASGVLWEGGRVRRAVKGVTLAGNLLGLLKKIDAVASDLSWQGAFGSPTFRVSGLSIGGSGKTL